MAPADWQALIAASGTLSPGEALATTDSLWAAFRAGKAPAAWLFAEARAVAANPDSTASIDGGRRIAGLRSRGLISAASLPAYRALLASIYTPRLTALGFNPAAGAYAKDDPGRQNLRHELVNLVADDARDPAVRNKLKSAGEKYLAGDTAALDSGFLGAALTVVAEEGRSACCEDAGRQGVIERGPGLPPGCSRRRCVQWAARRRQLSPVARRQADAEL
ncbi:ERAP1-like C-terminal domain-containing protein [Sphingomonas sp. H160509]|uniref:ERAP1-like C-terminal domain-containing protein n=1 Tax=Sphingomonas sp. H160509 TaxID=2955313 RepID=UPI0021E78A92|nr:ERAP1-like C-terminal domain-containing protein [Sphingomonas sp. H160509]MDD1450511.1 ERAP1-like C-terminal domain-containing protein [Sphingomonas sp. H160509]